MFRTLIYPLSGACDCSVELPHWLYCSWFSVCWSFGVVGLEWYPCCRLKQNCSCASASNMDTTPTQPHRNSNTHWTKNNTTNVVIQQNSHKLLIVDILMSETCWAHKKWNKIAGDIKLVFYSSTISQDIQFLVWDSNWELPGMWWHVSTHTYIRAHMHVHIHTHSHTNKQTHHVTKDCKPGFGVRTASVFLKIFSVHALVTSERSARFSKWASSSVFSDVPSFSSVS